MSQVTKSKWADLEKQIENLESSRKDREDNEKLIKLKLLLSIAKSLDSICNYGIIAYDRA